MKSDTKRMNKQGENLSYEQPSLKNYGTMKELTPDSGGSGADGAGRGRDPKGVI